MPRSPDYRNETSNFDYEHSNPKLKTIDPNQ
jgi:hypothetical protein